MSRVSKPSSTIEILASAAATIAAMTAIQRLSHPESGAGASALWSIRHREWCPPALHREGGGPPGRFAPRQRGHGRGFLLVARCST